MFSPIPSVFALFAVAVAGQSLPSGNISAAMLVCQALNATFPTLVAFPGSTQYDNDIEHWAISSTQNATCSIEPVNQDQVSVIFEKINLFRAPFAIKSGGHAYAVTFSSTLGVQISLAKFNTLTYNAASNTAVIGTGLTWDQVYLALQPFNVTVVGGRVNGVGSGLSLGGGYSWKSNQYGLTIDTITAFDLVLPTGIQLHVTQASNPGLFFGLRGGLNNFGIVTAITYQTKPQGLVFAGTITYAANVTDSVNSAISAFSLTNNDPKAEIIFTYGYLAGSFFSFVNLFYDAPTAPAGTFDAFLAIPSTSNDVITQTFVDFLNQGGGLPPIGDFEISQNGIPIVKYTVPILETMVSQVQSTGATLSGLFPTTLVGVSASGEPFSTLFSHSQGGAYPHGPARPVTPSALVAIFQQVSAPDPATMYPVFVQAVKNMSVAVQTTAITQGQSLATDVHYPNYALPDTPLVLLYDGNLPALHALADIWDPLNTMSLTGGFRLHT